MAKSKTPFTKAWAKVVAKAWTDEPFKKRLLKNPEKVLKEMGVVIPAGFKLKVQEQKNGTIHLILPAKPKGALSEKELKAAMGGACGERCGHGCDPGSCIGSSGCEALGIRRKQ